MNIDNTAIQQVISF